MVMDFLQFALFNSAPPRQAIKNQRFGAGIFPAPKRWSAN
jgi:hypothetical protein